SVRHAVARGARHISLIPARRGAGWGEFNADLPEFSIGPLGDLYDQTLEDTGGQSCLTVDLWNVNTTVSSLDEARAIQRLNAAMLRQVPTHAVED
ncbi:MAG: hypothetical protein AAFV88_24840, partial [Planctomycetota bacterium]